MITNKATCDLKLQTYEGIISKIIRLDDNNKIRFKTLPLTSDFNSKFPWMRIMRKRSQENMDQNISISSHEKFEFQIEPFCTKGIDNGKTGEFLVEKVKLKSVLVVDHKEKLELKK